MTYKAEAQHAVPAQYIESPTLLNELTTDIKHRLAIEISKRVLEKCKTSTDIRSHELGHHRLCIHTEVAILTEDEAHEIRQSLMRMRRAVHSAERVGIITVEAAVFEALKTELTQLENILRNGIN